MRPQSERKTRILYSVGMVGLLFVAYCNTYVEPRGVWDENDPLYREVIRVLHHPKLLEKIGFPIETGLASQIQTPKSHTIDMAPFRYLMVTNGFPNIKKKMIDLK